MPTKFEFWDNQEGNTGTIDIFDYQTANAGTSPPPTPPFLQGDENQQVFIWKNKAIAVNI